ncbi:MAG: response regulator, partial [Kangiellaceae bacterium]|nr:response regulator [Kangiellaceae bacterium]
MSNEQKEIKILCVDDEKNILASLKRVFRKDGYKIFLAESGAEGLQVLREQNIDLIISDMRMPHMDGAEFLNVANDIRKNVPSILLTGYSDQESTVRAINDGQISGYISKPWDEFDLKLKIKSLLKISHLEKEKERLLL